MLRLRRKWLVVALSIVGAVAAALLLAQDQITLRVRSPHAADDPHFPDYLASLIGAPVSRGDRYVVLRNGDEIFPVMRQAVERAARRISFESFIYSQGEVSGRFTQAFADAARRGVAVRIVLDSFGAYDLPASSRRNLEDAGVRVVWFNPVRPWTVEEANYRSHRKVLVVDGEVGFTGGVGLADHWQGHAQDADHWRDTQFQVSGPAVRALEACFYENWLESGGMEAPALDPEPRAQGTSARSVVIWSNPVGGAGNVKLLYLLSIAGARRTIDIQSPYFILDESTRFALDEARRRGVVVRVLTEGENTDAKSVKQASRHAYDGLLSGGYRIFEYQPTMMHVKAMVVDGVWSVIGSANFDNRSLELNDELTIGVADADLASALVRDFRDDLRRSRELRLDEWRRRPLDRKLSETFWNLFAEIF